MFGRRLWPIFILIFLILAFVLIIWLHRTPTKKEGFQAGITRGTGPHPQGILQGGSTPVGLYNDYGSGANKSWVRYPSQFDYPYNPEKPYGEWGKSPFNSYYDTYEENENNAIAAAAMKFKNLKPVITPIPDYGDTLGVFDSETPTIPWDADNKEQNQSDILWGQVSQEASKSIFLKTWLQTVISASSNMLPCGEKSAHFCYSSPLLGVSTTDPKMAVVYTVADTTAQSLGGAITAQISLQNTGRFDTMNVKDIIKSFESSKDTVKYVKGLAKVPLENIKTVTVQLGHALNSIGAKKIALLAKSVLASLKARLIASASETALKFAANSGAILGSVWAAAGAATAAAAAQAGVNPVSTGLAVALTILATALNIIFGFCGMLIMAVNSLVTPIVQSVFHPGGVCPPNTKRLSQLMPEGAWVFIGTTIPLGMFLELFDPYVCWGPDAPYGHLMIPPKMPAFMSDRTLSLTYHANWLSGNSSNIPVANPPTLQPDPIPTGYKYLNQSDIASSNNMNSIIEAASAQATALINAGAAAASAAAIAAGGTAAAGAAAAAKYRSKQMVAGSSGANIIVSDCPANTVPSQDGLTCVGNSYKTNVKAPVFSACPAGTYDDGFNCWTTRTAAEGCTGGDLVITTGTTWDDTTGFLSSKVTSLFCNGIFQATNNNITTWANQRITCPPEGTTGYTAVGLLCYANCQTGYSRVGAMCKSTNSVTREYKFTTSSMYYNQVMNTTILKDLTQVQVPYCNFADPVMLNRMAQFYYDNARLNPQVNEDGTITIQMITGFVGVAASSELSCDVICTIKFVTYDPITGGRYSVVLGCADSYKDDDAFRGCPFCYRRFYFIRAPGDPQGIFTVTGCTFADYTAPDSMNLSADPNSNLVPSLPKKFDVINKEATIIDVQNLKRNLENGQIAMQAGQGLTDVAVMIAMSKVGGAAGGRVAGQTGQAVGGLAGGLGAGILSSLWLTEAMNNASNSSIETSVIDGAVNTFVAGSGNNLSVISNNNWWTINHGPIYEIAAGVTPNIDFCANTIIGINHCAHKYVIRDMVDKYHNEFQTSHMKQITAIEPRGINGCYYKFIKVEFDAATNMEGVIEQEDELILTHQIGDYATCTFKPDLITRNMSDPSYPIRSYLDTVTATSEKPRVIYPTRDTIYTSDLFARFVRVRGAAGGTLAVTQIAVFDVSGDNVSINKTTYATSASLTSAPADSVVNGSITVTNTPGSYWSPATNTDTEYWEVDLGKNMNISELVYIGTIISASGGNVGVNLGVRIQFLYTNGATDTPIYEFTLPKTDAVQYISLYSSMYTRPSYPMAGPIKIPRPISRGIILAPQQGCINKCEDKDVIDSVIKQYNTNNEGSEIIKILAGITAKTNLCEYQAEVLVTDVPATQSGSGSASPGKKSVVKQYLSMPIAVNSAKRLGRVFGRFLRIIPTFTPGTIMQISNVIVWNAIPDGTGGAMKAGYIISAGKSTSFYNEYYEINEMPPAAPGRGSTTQRGPLLFRARDNDPATFFQIDLGDTEQGSTPGNQEIYQIQFIAQSDVQVPNSIKGIELQVYADRPGDEVNCCNGTYPPIWRYILPSNDLNQMIIVTPPAQCEFTLGTTTPMLKPVYLLPDTPPFTTTDTSGGVFTYSGIISSLQSAWGTLSGSSGILPLKSQDLVTPIENNVKQSDAIVQNILETVAGAQTITGTSKKCSDTDVMGAMMTAYNISRGPADTDDTGLVKYTMNRILKSGQSTPTTCDVLFEELYEIYEDYMVDITDRANKGSEIKAVRFKMSAVGGNAVPAQDKPGSPPKNIIDLSSNALGVLTNVSLVSPPFSGPTYAVNCMDPTWLRIYRPILEAVTRKSSGYTIRSSFRDITGTFQSTPLTCEYLMTKDDTYTSTAQNYSYKENGINTVAKAVFSLGSDGKTVTFKSITEYYPDDITESADQLRTYIGGREVILPNLSYYDPTKLVSKRVNTTPISF
jgi:hypothetical protein